MNEAVADTDCLNSLKQATQEEKGEHWAKAVYEIQNIKGTKEGSVWDTQLKKTEGHNEWAILYRRLVMHYRAFLSHKYRVTFLQCFGRTKC
jgi:hypothetical protein